MELASEFRYGDRCMDPRTLTIAMSQSGETADTIEAVKIAQRSRRADHRHLQRRRLASHPHRRRDALHARRPRDLRRRDQNVRLASDRGDAARALPRARAQVGADRAPARDRRRHEAAAGGDRRRAQHVRRREEGREESAQGALGAVPRPLRELPDRARRRAQAQGDLLHPRRGLRGGRDEARPDRAARLEDAGHRHRDRRPRAREDPLEHRRSPKRAKPRSSWSRTTATKKPPRSPTTSFGSRASTSCSRRSST